MSLPLSAQLSSRYAFVAGHGEVSWHHTYDHNNYVARDWNNDGRHDVLSLTSVYSWNRDHSKVPLVQPHAFLSNADGSYTHTWVGGAPIHTLTTEWYGDYFSKREIIVGNNQELLDLKFLFIKGAPIRNILRVENIYPYGHYKYADLADDIILKETTLQLLPEASAYKLKAVISGHGHAGPRNCCEWDSKTHTWYSQGYELFRWNVWTDCGNNPIYPQGGTWPFDRAGWCPGAIVDEHEFCLLYTSPSPRDLSTSRMPSSA